MFLIYPFAGDGIGQRRNLVGELRQRVQPGANLFWRSCLPSRRSCRHPLSQNFFNVLLNWDAACLRLRCQFIWNIDSDLHSETLARSGDRVKNVWSGHSCPPTFLYLAWNQRSAEEGCPSLRSLQGWGFARACSDGFDLPEFLIASAAPSLRSLQGWAFVKLAAKGFGPPILQSPPACAAVATLIVPD